MLNKKTLAIITLSVSLVIAFSGYVFYKKFEHNIRTEKEVDLTAIAQLKINQIEQWLTERTADIRVLSQSPFFTKNIENWLNNPSDKELENSIKTRLAIPKVEYNYESAFIISPENKILLSSDKLDSPIDKQLAAKIDEAVYKNDIVHSDFYYCEAEKMVHYDVIAPIFNTKEKHIATLILRADPSKYLYPLIQTWPTPSETSETLLIRKEGDHVLFLNELRHQSGTALNLTIPLAEKTLPAVMAADGTVGIVTGIDYRDMEVVAYVAPVPGTNWFMVSKIDKSELFHELVSQGSLVFFSTFLIILLVGIGIALFYNLRQKNIYRSLWETEEEYKTTLYSIGDAVITTDKDGKVKQINKVAEELTGWNENDAKDLLLTEIFNIVNEETRAQVENPVDKVLRNGTIVGLANHTLLISKDGKETPIADSAAPIRNGIGEIIGVVLVFRDQSEEKRHFEEMKAARYFAENIIEALHEGLLVLDSDLKIINANQTFFKSFGFKKAEIIGKDFFQISDCVWYQKELKEQLENILPKNTKFDNFEIACHFEAIGTRVLNMNAREIESVDKNSKNILLAINDITEKQKLIEELVISKKKAEESNNLKTAFLANMSHEIRTPLNGILGFSSMIVDEELPQQNKEHYFKIIESSGQRLLSIVNDILDISLIQSNQIRIKNSTFGLQDFLQDLFLFYNTLMKDKINEIEFRCDLSTNEKDIKIDSDKDRLFQVFKNLLDNSFKFTKTGFVHFGAIHADHHVKFYVKDSGSGIPDDQLNLIFEKFQQIESSKGKHSEGTGLGLAIAKGLVDRMGGTIWVESKVGQGTEFYFKLPISNRLN